MPTAADTRRLWAAVQMALAAWLPAYYAPAYRQMELRKFDEKIRKRVLGIQEQMQRERVNSLRSAIGLRHLKELGTGRGGRRMKYPVPLTKAVVTAGSQQQHSESPESSLLSGSKITAS